MPYLTQLAEVARRTGYPVEEISGWRSRGHGPQPSVQGVVCHHTAGATAGGEYPSLAVVRDGRAGLSGPLSHFGLGRSGRIYVIAAGRCWHNAPSTSPQHTNSTSIGIEAENNGRQPWPAVQVDAYKRLCAELCREFGLPASRVKAHREVNTGKPDPHSIDMTAFRADVARLIEGDDMPLSKDDVTKIWQTDGIIPAADDNPGNPEWKPSYHIYDIGRRLRRVEAMLTGLANQAPDVDEDAIAAAVLAHLTPERIAAAIPAEFAEQVVSALGERLAPKEGS